VHSPIGSFGARQALAGHAPPAAALSHCSLPFTTPSPQNAPHVQLGWQWPGHAASSLPSHCSPACTTLSPQDAAAQVQFAWH
jgi:hypothetical protein